MAHTPDDERFADGFLDDFYAESEEHLTLIRRHLLALEAVLPHGVPPSGVLDDMFRSFHSLKGISGMVELEHAEAVAHDMEGYLRALKDGDVALSRAGVEALIDGTRAMERVIAARKERTAPPDIGPARAALAAVVPSASTTPSRRARRPRSAGRTLTPHPAGAQTEPTPSQTSWKVMFAPSNELLARGVNVNTVRERLREVGEIVQARPTVTPSGAIAFEFILNSDARADVFEKWAADGLSAHPVSPVRSAPEGEEPGVALEGPHGERPLPSSITSRMVRVDLGRLDEVMRILSDLVVSRSRLHAAVGRISRQLPSHAFRPIEEATLAIERQVRELRESVMRVRLVPVREIFNRMPFVVRDLARDNEKQVKLDLRGQDTEIDKFLIERMMDPILHLVRNAISHGIEPPAERAARGKPARGTIGLRAAAVGEMVVIEVEDDGRGVDRAEVLARARATGLQVSDSVDTAQLLEVLCSSGFSTRDRADRASGRGMGMAVVKRAVEQLSGTVAMQTEPGRGTRFVLTLPVTLAIIDALVCIVGGARYAVPQSAVTEVLEVALDDIRVLENNEIFRYRNGSLPLVRVADLLGLDRSVRHGRLHVFVVGTGAQVVGLGVDRIQGQREIVVRAVADPLLRVEGLTGATDLGDGEPVLILDPPALVRLASRRAGAGVAR